jgi:hypothetical protein
VLPAFEVLLVVVFMALLLGRRRSPVQTARARGVEARMSPASGLIPAVPRVRRPAIMNRTPGRHRLVDKLGPLLAAVPEGELRDGSEPSADQTTGPVLS